MATTPPVAAPTSNGSGVQLVVNTQPASIINHIVLLCIVFVITSLAVALRLWVRIAMLKAYRKDDTALILSHLFNSASAILWTFIRVQEAKYEPRSPALFHALSTPYVVILVAYFIGNALVKFAIATLFLRAVQRTWQKWFILIPMIVIVANCPVVMFTILFSCGVPVDTARILGDVDCPMGTRLETALGIQASTVNTVCDWLFAAIPFYMVFKAKGWTRAAKISTCIILGLAVIASIISIVKIPLFIHTRLGPTFFETNAMTSYLSIIETAVAGLAVSVATLKPLLSLRLPTRQDGEMIVGTEPAAPNASAGRRWFYADAVPRLQTRRQGRSTRLGVLPSMLGTNMSLASRLDTGDDEVALAGLSPTRWTKQPGIQVSTVAVIHEIPIGETPVLRPG